MIRHAQPDLFGESDEREALYARMQQPHTCPSCGLTERNGLLFEISHGYRVTLAGLEGIGGFPIRDHPIYGTRCTAQNLKRNHIYYHVAHRNHDALMRDVTLAAELGMDFETIIADASREARS